MSKTKRQIFPIVTPLREWLFVPEDQIKRTIHIVDGKEVKTAPYRFGQEFDFYAVNDLDARKEIPKLKLKLNTIHLSRGDMKIVHYFNYTEFLGPMLPFETGHEHDENMYLNFESKQEDNHVSIRGRFNPLTGAMLVTCESKYFNAHGFTLEVTEIS